jgi:VWFA-related protein
VHGIRRIGLLYVVLMLAAPTVAPPQSQKVLDSQTLRVDVNLVNVVFTVTDEIGRFMTDLDRDDFTVYEDDTRQGIQNFHTETNLPLRISLLIDASGSILNKLRFEQQAALDFFSETLRPDTDLASVITFDSYVNLMQDFTDNAEVLSDAVARVKAGGGTELFDGIYLTVIRNLAEQDGRRVLIVITDGADNSSEFTVKQAIDAAQKHDVIVYAVSTNRVQTRRVKGNFGQTVSVSHPILPEQIQGDVVLAQLAEETGGYVLFPERREDLSSIFREIQETLRSQYVLSYVPTNTARDGGFRRIRIDVAAAAYTTNARAGYYARDDEPPDVGRDLREAARIGSVQDIERLLNEGAYVDSEDTEGWSPLMLSVREGKAGAARVLLMAGADPNVPSRDGEYPLTWAIGAGRSQLVCDLMDAGADMRLVSDALTVGERWEVIRTRMPEMVAECHAAPPMLDGPTIEDLLARQPGTVPEVLDRRPDRPYTKIRAIQYVGEAMQTAPLGFSKTTGPMPPDVRRRILSGAIIPDALQMGADAIVILEARAIYEVKESLNGTWSTKSETGGNRTTDLGRRIVRIKYILFADAIKYRF